MGTAQLEAVVCNRSSGVSARLAECSKAGLNFSVARSLADVEDAWGLVHDAVIRSGVIPPDPTGIYTVPQAITPDTLVLLARLISVPFATLTAIPDNPAGFTLDAAFPDDVAALRQEGGRLMEMCLFADRRASITRSFMSVVELARFAFFYARNLGITDIITAVPADHASFLMKYFAFEPQGDRGRSPMLHGQPCRLLRIGVAERLRREPLPPEIAYYMEKPVQPAEFDCRFQFSQSQLLGSNIARSLETRSSQ